jgi:NDP-sugar pyrophosphorylase family protein
MVNNIAGAILAAGTGERLRAAAGGLPKPLVEINGQTLLSLQATTIMEAGASPVLTVVSSETDRLIRARGIRLPAQLELAVKNTPNSMETLFALGERLPAGRFLLATVDAMLPRAEFMRFVAGAFESTAPDSPGGFDGALAVARWRGDRRPLFADVAPDGLIKSLGGDAGPLVTAGVYMFSTSIFGCVAQARDAGLGALREFLGYLVRRGMRFRAFEVSGAIDVDEGPDLEAARAMLAGQLRHGAARGGRG